MRPDPRITPGRSRLARETLSRHVRATLTVVDSVALSADLFAVGNDEDNTLRIFRAKEGGPPVGTLDLSTFLISEMKKNFVQHFHLERATSLQSPSLIQMKRE